VRTARGDGTLAYIAGMKLPSLWWFLPTSLALALVAGCDSSGPSDLRGFSTLVTQEGHHFFIRGDTTFYRQNCWAGPPVECEWLLTMYPDDVPGELQRPFYITIGTRIVPFRNGVPAPGTYPLRFNGVPIILQITSGAYNRIWLSAEGALTITHSDSSRLAGTFSAQMKHPGRMGLPDLFITGALDIIPR
jgi:hypothetical protein